MKAIAVDETGTLTVVENLEEPDLPSGHVLVRITAGGVCGSDLTGLDHRLGRTGPTRVLGHEGGGVVVAVGAGVTSHQPGDVVVIEPNYVCFRCEWCERGETKMCAERTVVGRDLPGLFSEFVAVPASFAWTLPAATPGEALASFEAAMVARVAVQRMAVLDEERTLVIGAGSQGQCVIASLLERGIKAAVMEPNEHKLQQALAQGARDAAADSNERFQVVFETSGTGAGLATAIDRASALARLCLIGQSEQPVPLTTRPIVQKELTIQGSLIYNHPADFGSAVQQLEAGHFPPTVGLREPVGPRQAVHDLQRARSLDGKIWIDFSDWSV